MAPTIIKKSGELDKRTIYRMTMGQNNTSVKDLADGDFMNVAAFVIFSDVDSKGETRELISVMGKDDVIWTAASSTFRREFEKIWDVFEGEEFGIKKISGTAKNGRDFVSCTLL